MMKKFQIAIPGNINYQQGWVEERNPTLTDIAKWQHDPHSGTKPVGFRGAQPNRTTSRDILCLHKNISRETLPHHATRHFSGQEEARRPNRKGFRPVAEFSDRSGDKAIVSMRQT